MGDHQKHVVGPLAAAIVACAACSFDPAVRGLATERVGAADLELVRTLDRSGAYVLASARAGEARSILHWHRGTRCDVPGGYPHLLRPLRAPVGTGEGARQLVLPMVAAGEAHDDAALSAVDEHCTSLGELGALQRDSVKTRASARDQRDVLYARTAKGDLVALDPFRRPGLQTLAQGSSAFWPTALDDGRDAVWVLAGSRLALLALEGELVRVLGKAVSEAELDARTGKLAYVDGGQLVLAEPPSFVPRALASDACTPRFAGEDLYAFAPCAEQRLLALYGHDDAPIRYPAGVVAALRRGELEVVYGERDGAPTMTLNDGQGRAQELDPPLRPDASYLLDDGRLIGLTADGRLASHDSRQRRFRVLLEQVSDLLASYRGKSRSYWFVAYHGRRGGLGTLSGIASGDLSSWTLAEDVPPASERGYRLDVGSAFPSGTFPEPVLVALADAAPAADDRPARGSLRATLISGKPAGELAGGVDSYLLVAAPLPGILYRVPDGARSGLYYVPL